MLHGLIIAAALGAGWGCVRLARGRALAWLALPLLGAVCSALLWFLTGPGNEALSGISLAWLGLAAGGGLGAAAHSDWNTRRSIGLSLAVLALSVEGALVLGLLGQGRSASASPSWILLFGGVALALVAFRRGVLPRQAAWSARLRGAVSLCVVLGVGIWWRYTEGLQSASLASLAGDLLANVSHQGAWAVWGAACVGGVLLLGASDAPWTRRFGASAALACGVLMPAPVLAMRWVVQEHCEDHLPKPRGVFDATPSDPPIEIPEGWCRAPTTPSLRCPGVPTLYQQGRGTGWVARRLERDPLDTLWGERWGRPGSVMSEALRVDQPAPHLGSWLVSGGNREPEDLDGTLGELLERVPECGLGIRPAPAMVLDLELASGGEVLSADLRGAEGYGLGEQACVVELALALAFPVSACPGTQRLMVPVFAGLEQD